jgi:hypothetical protein
LKRIKYFFFIEVIFFVLCSCAVTHNKKDLIDFKNNEISNSELRIDGFYFYEYETEPSYLYNTTEMIKRIDAFFIYDDGFTLFLSGIDGLYPYYCVEKQIFENSFKNAQTNIQQMIKAQSSSDNLIRKWCNFDPKYINHKGLTKITKTDKRIKIQYYQTESQNLNTDSFNSYYLYEKNGEIVNDSTFIINEIKSYRLNKIEKVNQMYKFRKSPKPKLNNYFKK